jgi:uncharacterized protein (DUF305 family)
MKKIILVAAGALALASVTAYAQMNHGNSQGQPHQGMTRESMQSQMQGHQMHGQMHKQLHGQMHGQAQGPMHGQMHNQGHGESGGHGEHGADVPRGDRGPSSMAFHGINRQMHHGMNITFTGNTDVDFVTGMIPHHQGAVDMAKVVLAFGKDAEIRRLAEAVIRAQESEIARMRAWLERNAQ